MTITHSEAGRMSRLSTQQDEINEYAEKYRPQIELIYYENGITVTRYEAGYAEGYMCHHVVKPTGRNSSHEI